MEKEKRGMAFCQARDIETNSNCVSNIEAKKVAKDCTSRFDQSLQVARDICRASRKFRRDFLELLRKHGSNLPLKGVKHEEEYRQLGCNLQDIDKNREFW